jgi:glycosyltransferase involved in cell wall biosynthesis
MRFLIMKILHSHTELNKTCGITKILFLLAKNPSDGYEHLIFAIGGDNVELFINNGINTIICKRKKYSPIDIVKTVYDLVKICKKENINIIHAHSRYFDYLASIAARFINISRITSVQSKVYGMKRLSYKSPYLIAPCNSIREHLVNVFRVKESRISVVNNFVDDYHNNNSAKYSLSGQKILLFVGRFSKEKGVDILIQAFKKLQIYENDVRLILVGAGAEEKYLRKYIINNKLNAELIQPYENINKYYLNAFAIVLPSRVDPFPLVMLEAGIMAKPFIGAAVDGIKEFIENGKDGLLVKPGNVDELNLAMELMINDPKRAEKMGVLLSKKVKQKCLSNVIIQKYTEIYKRIISND